MVEFDEEDDGDAEKKIFIIGGYGGHGSTRDFSMDVHALDIDNWVWSKIDRIKGTAPKPRADHTVAVADNLLILCGGRGSSVQDKKAGTFSGYFDDVHILDLADQEWKRPPGLGPDGGEPMWPELPNTLWNHSAVAIESVPSYRMFVFGGQKAEFSYADQVSILDTGRMAWGNAVFAQGSGFPEAREDCSIAYDAKTCNIVFFGGWKQGWLDDLWCLNVAGIVGPPYAVQSITPNTGPVTGNTPISIRGIGFINEKSVQVKFSDGRREATVSGKYKSEFEIECNTPSFEKFGPMEVMVRVSIKGDPFTVNKALFSFFVNTKAAKCMCFGPGLLPDAGKAGRPLQFIMQAKDSTGKARNSGGDAITVKVSSPATTMDVPFSIHDYADGRYLISYVPPVPGAYECHVTLDENAFDDDDTYLHVRGSPFNLDVREAWQELEIKGAAPATKDRLKTWSIGSKVYVMPEDKPEDEEEEEEEEEGGEEAPAPEEDGAAPADPSPAPEEVAPEAEPPAADGEAPAAADGEEAAPAAEGEAAEGEAAAAPEPVAPPPPAPAAGSLPARAPKPNWAPPESLAVLDTETLTWSTITPTVEDMPDFAAIEAEQMKTLKKSGVPEAVAFAMLEPKKKVKWSSLPGVSGDVPSPRKQCQLEVTKDSMLIYGGVNSEGDFFDELYSVSLPDLVFTRLHQSEMVNKLTSETKKSCFVAGKLLSVTSSEKGPLDVVTSLAIDELQTNGNDFVPEMIASLKSRVAVVEKQVKVIAEGMETTPEDGDFEGLRHAMAQIFDVKTKSDAIEYELDNLADLATYLSMDNASAVQPSANKVGTLQEMFGVAKKRMPVLKKALRPLIEGQSARIQGEITEFEAQVEGHLATFQKEPIFLYENGVNPSYERLDELHKDLLDIESAAAEFVELATLFDFPEAMNKSSEMVTSMRTDVILVKKLWDLVNIVQTTLEEWQGTLWNDINVGGMEEEAKTLAKSIKSLDKRLRNFDAYLGIDTFLKNFLVTLPAVSDLRSPSMRERHWKLLMKVTGVEFAMGADFSLAHLTALQLHKFVDDVGEVVDRAVKEDKMEQTLAKLKVTWAVIEFEFDQHRDTDVYLMKMKEEDFETLEDNQLVVQGMMASKYLATFEEEVTGWQRKLGNVSDVLAQMSEVQRKWAYLETLFIGSDEVKKELPESTERFVGIDKTFKVCLGAIHKIKNAVNATDVEGQQKTLESMGVDLELCEKDLADFLESKRRIFPRFYFLATTYLLDVLSK